MPDNEPGSAVLALFDMIISEIKQSQPVRSDNKPLGGGMVYSMMVLGMPVDPIDYSKPWSPMGDTTLQDATATPAAVPAAGGAAPAVAGGAAGPAAGPAAGTAPATAGTAASAAANRASMAAAFKTSLLANVMLQVTTDGTYLEYPVGRHLSFEYDSILSGMQPLPEPPLDPAVQQQIDDARKVLYEFDANGNQLGPTPLYRAYKNNALAYATAKANYATAETKAQSDPSLAQAFPVTSTPLQQAVDNAYNDLIAGGADQVEKALDIIESSGVSMQDHMIAQARKTYDAWDLGLAGIVPDRIPYSFVEPVSWCDPNDDQIGWQSLKITSDDYQSYDASKWVASNQGSFKQDASSNAGGLSVGFALWSVGGSVGQSNASAQWQGSSQYTFDQTLHNSAKNLTISLEYGLATIYRPWLISDLFYMGNWYLVGSKKNSISDGTIANQANTAAPLLPMIPQQFLVIRNVSISAEDWGDDLQILQDSYSGYAGDTNSNSTQVSANGGMSLGFINFGGSFSHSSSHADGQEQSFAGASAQSYFGTTFDGTTLAISGAQIIAFLNDIVPASPPLDDPAQSAPAPAPTGTTH